MTEVKKTKKSLFWYWHQYQKQLRFSLKCLNRYTVHLSNIRLLETGTCHHFPTVSHTPTCNLTDVTTHHESESGRKKKKYYNISKKKYLLKGNVRPCLLICSSTSELQSVLRTMKGGEQILSSNKKRSKITREELMKLKCGNKYSLKAKKRSWKVSVKQK